MYFPDSIRARFGRRGDDCKNAVHGSNNRKQAEKEIHFFFPECKNCSSTLLSLNVFNVANIFNNIVLILN